MSKTTPFIIGTLLIGAVVIATGCGAPAANTSTNTANRNTNSTTANSNTNTNTSTSTTTAVETSEPAQYEAKVTIKLEAIGSQQTVAMPTLGATVARNAADRRMEFTMPAGGRVVYLDKAGTNYIILPDKKQYAEVNRESTGFEIRRMLMPEQIVQQVKSMQGLERVGEEQYNGRTVTRYKYAAVANTQTQAGQVQTDSFLLVDKETGLPLRSETLSQASGSVQGYSGVRVVTEIADVKTTVGPELFELPQGLQKIESEQVRAQIDMIFNAVAQIVTQMLKQGQSAPANTGGTPQ